MRDSGIVSVLFYLHIRTFLIFMFPSKACLFLFIENKMLECISVYITVT